MKAAEQLGPSTIPSTTATNALLVIGVKAPGALQELVTTSENGGDGTAVVNSADQGLEHIETWLKERTLCGQYPKFYCLLQSSQLAVVVGVIEDKLTQLYFATKGMFERPEEYNGDKDVEHFIRLLKEAWFPTEKGDSIDRLKITVAKQLINGLKHAALDGHSTPAVMWRSFRCSDLLQLTRETGG
ncbi:hypothetical protein FOXG_01727 [Fusarium oxysporum f. sp. lycopersici 4287]|uniref:Uncharacterized protein n=2 Tax=Fusarium oxysporum TaxID=5507 RepID=A0A0J9UEV5_FUSO4|nr:hypothetical protein FOXG_01727 [Fusarium oxysporum f. sp. lycopersici 4287]EXK42399.1 hypothetical protein FOMG_05383 [Fusarium oxysporum f. sp. melonis 26406]KNA96625.1 hypothetical protein FOXG_01727 [Fusarium oxysporum f. sp. lycopersici 4287]